MKNVVIYSRVSTDNQDNNRQLTDLLNHSGVFNYNVVKTFTDKISGSTKLDERPGLNELKQFIKTNNIKLILVSEITRIGRNNLETLKIINDFKNDGVCIYSKKENIFTLNDDGTSNSHGDMVIGILSAISQNELDTIKYRIKSGKRQSIVENKHFSGGKFIPYGYRLENKMLVIDDKESKVIKEIFNLYLQNYGSQKISKILNEKKTPTRLTTPDKTFYWRSETIRFIVRNPIYKGVYNFKGEIIERLDLQIIDTETFDRVNKNLNSHATKQNKHKTYYNLLDEIPKICGVCGKSYHPKRRKIKYSDKIQGNYKCSSDRYFGVECDNNSISIQRLDNTIYYLLRRTDDIKRRYEKFKKNNPVEDEIKQINLDIDRVNKKIKYNQTLLEKSIDMFKLDVIDKITLVKDTQKYKTENQKLKNEIIFKKENIETLRQLKIKQITINEYFNNLKNNPLSLKDLVKTLINKIVIHPVNEMGILTGIRNDITYCIELYLNNIPNPIICLLSQRTNKISPIVKGIYNPKTRVVNNKHNLTIVETRHEVDYDNLISN